VAPTAQIEGEWLDRVAQLLAEPLTAMPDAALGAALGGTFDLLGTSFNSRPPGPGVLRLTSRRGMTARMRDLVERGPGAVDHLHPLLVYYASTAADRPMQIADLPPAFARPGLLGPWREFARPDGFEHVMLLPLQRHHRAFAMARDTPFSPSETALAQRLWRLLRGLDRQVSALAGVRLDPPAARCLLTPRESAVFGLVAQGMTAAAAARRLAVSERTVHKHLERVYRKLGASDRVTAVLRAQRAGLLAV
jgi:DNA-binding CsgD family transcriptional regulator